MQYQYVETLTELETMSGSLAGIEWRFWSKVDVQWLNPGMEYHGWEDADEDKCWQWTASTSEGYGLFRLNRKLEKSHRVSWMLNYGGIPDGIQVLHKCDNRPCCNPHHLFLGTLQDNMADRNAKGRQARLKGEAHGMAKVNEDMVRAMRTLRKRGWTLYRIADKFGLHFGQVSKIVRGDAWSHVS